MLTTIGKAVVVIANVLFDGGVAETVSEAGLKNFRINRISQGKSFKKIM